MILKKAWIYFLLIPNVLYRLCVTQKMYFLFAGETAFTNAMCFVDTEN